MLNTNSKTRRLLFAFGLIGAGLLGSHNATADDATCKAELHNGISRTLKEYLKRLRADPDNRLVLKGVKGVSDTLLALKDETYQIDITTALSNQNIADDPQAFVVFNVSPECEKAAKEILKNLPVHPDTIPPGMPLPPTIKRNLRSENSSQAIIS